MAVISVNIPNKLAKKVKPYSVISFDEFEKLTEDYYETLVDFGDDGVPAKDVLKFLKSL